ncbi:hypothetical protein TspCOW1_20030 [Thiohalobacter sp. COW1]|uniref:DUF1499 domain-containing protein n=1 Tax=Thiohalobacter thiocyanaticus TaxID=585455 RepID=A0A1Z4VNA5_9GAMM|nr:MULTISPECIES: DUF1499 domain-containing protein [Thiohalobacter]BAZ93089.1 uncharacterized protein FOKN1_0687 [Thiohalobacter thiocyanaticus]BCO31900.1 hypothetical protein TspCOW1_20030 [Thiohalobacter sp. COW1]
MKAVLLILAALILLAMITLAVLALHSRSQAPPGRVDGRLPPCPDSPNCVCSEYPADSAHYVEPLRLPGDLSPASVLDRLGEQVRSLGGTVTTVQPDYLVAGFRSRVFGFVDDLQLRPDAQAGVVHVRSASRVGHSDLGVNRQRVEALRQRWRQAGGVGRTVAEK